MGLENKQNALLLLVTHLQYHCCNVSCRQRWAQQTLKMKKCATVYNYIETLSSWYVGLSEHSDIPHKTEKKHMKNILPSAHAPNCQEWGGFL